MIDKEQNVASDQDMQGLESNCDDGGDHANLSANNPSQEGDLEYDDVRMLRSETSVSMGFTRPKLVQIGDGDEDEQSAPIWLITFTDTMALMLTFFVLLYGMAVPTEEKWTELSASLNNEFNHSYAPQYQDGPVDSINIDRIEFIRALDLGYLHTLLGRALEKQDVADAVEVFAQKDRLVISVSNDVLFEPGSIEMMEAGHDVLFVLGGVLSKIKNRIEIVGHADPRPIQSSTREGSIETNWDLSLQRALSVSFALDKVGYKRPISVRGMSSGRYDEISEEIPEERRLALARRVDIVVLNNSNLERVEFGSY